MKTWLPLAVIAAVFAFWVTAFSGAAPYRQAGILLHQRGNDGGPGKAVDIGAPDERQHVNYAIGLAEGKGFPVLRAGDGENYEAHQPPLAYLAEAAWLKLTGTNADSAGSGFLVRLPSLFAGLLLIGGVYFALFWGWGSQPAALAGAAFTAFLPMNVALCGAFSNDPLLFALMAWSLAFILRGLSDEGQARDLLAAGALAGLAVLTKTTGIALFPVLLLAVAIDQRGQKRVSLANSALALGLVLLIPLPWMLRNVSLYGDPFALKAFSAAFPNSPQASMFIAGMGASAYWLNMVAWWTARSFIGVFGYMDIFLFEQMHEKGDAIWSAMLFVLGLLFAVGAYSLIPRPKDEAEESKPSGAPLAVTLALFAVVLALFLQFNAKYFQGQARYLFPAMPFFALLAGRGAVRLAGSYREYAWVGLAAVLNFLCFLSLQAMQTGFPLRQMGGLP